MIEEFGAARLLSFDHDSATREPTVEVAHEALLRQWPRLAHWLAEDLDLLRAIAAIATSADTWDHGGRAASDLYRGGRLEQAAGVASASPERLRPVDADFIEASRVAADADRHREQRRVRRLRRLVAGTAVALVAALIAGGLALVSQRRADEAAASADTQRARAEEQTQAANTAAEEAAAATARAELATIISRSAALADDEPDLAVLLALEANRRMPGPDTEQSVLNALGSTPIANRVASQPLAFGPDENCVPGPSFDGLLDFGVVDGQMATRDNLTGEIRRHGPAPTPCPSWAGDEALDRRVVGDEERRRWRLGPFGGPDEAEVTFDDPILAGGPLRPSHRLVMAGRQTVTTIDDRTGDIVGTPIVIDGGEYLWNAVGGDGSRMAVSYVTRIGPETTGVTLILDTDTGQEIHRIATPTPLGRLAFDDTTGQLIGAQVDGPIVTFDPLTGEQLHSAGATATPLVALGVRSDGLIVAVSPGLVELIDRRTGPVGTAIELHDVLDARWRADGLLLALTASRQLDVIDLNGNALIAQTHEVGRFSSVTIRNGLAGIIELDTRAAEIVDLATGVRSPVQLPTAAGDRFPALAIVPGTEGTWAMSVNGEIGRWLDGRLVEEIVLAGRPLRGGVHGDRYAYVAELDDGSRVARLVSLVPGQLELVATIPTAGAAAAHPSPDGGIHVIDEDGVLHHHGPDGSPIDRIDVEARDATVMTIDPITGRLAIGGSGVTIVDPDTGAVEALPQVDAVADLGFAANGTMLAITGRDGTVRLWDVERGVSAGLAWQGTAHGNAFTPENDPSADSMWVTSSGKLLQIPLTGELWIRRACDVVGRDMTRAEWERLVPGSGPVQSACT